MAWTASLSPWAMLTRRQPASRRCFRMKRFTGASVKRPAGRQSSDSQHRSSFPNTSSITKKSAAPESWNFPLQGGVQLNEHPSRIEGRIAVDGSNGRPRFANQRASGRIAPSRIVRTRSERRSGGALSDRGSEAGKRGGLRNPDRELSAACVQSHLPSFGRPFGGAGYRSGSVPQSISQHWQVSRG